MAFRVLPVLLHHVHMINISRPLSAFPRALFYRENCMNLQQPCRYFYLNRQVYKKSSPFNNQFLDQVQVYGLNKEDHGLMSKLEADALAKKQNSLLVQIKGVSNENKIYKIMSSEEYKEHDRKAKEVAKQAKQKSVKKLTINSTISANDLNHKIGQARKHLEKGSSVEVILSKKKSDDTVFQRQTNSILQHFTETFKESAYVKGATKTNSTLKFYLQAIKPVEAPSKSPIPELLKIEELKERIEDEKEYPS